MKKEEIRIRDPFILPFKGKYYMYGTGTPGAEDIDIGRQFWCYTSADLENWSDPVCCFDASNDFWGEKNFWAPEVHYYRGKFYLLATFFADGKNRATQALIADQPDGPYRVFGEPLTPADWMCLDGTLYIEDGKPYMVFCHEWLQVGDGEMAVVPLKEDLSAPDGEAVTLFRASESGWAEDIRPDGRMGIITDGPWLIKEDGKLLMFWSSFRAGEYAVGVAESESGSVYGPWKHLEHLLFEKNGGHGMLFDGFDGKRYFALHSPNDRPLERACFYEIEKVNGVYRLK